MIKECNFKYDPFGSGDTYYCQLTESECPGEKKCVLYLRCIKNE